jgi:hypothetical protein
MRRLRHAALLTFGSSSDRSPRRRSVYPFWGQQINRCDLEELHQSTHNEINQIADSLENAIWLPSLDSNQRRCSQGDSRRAVSRDEKHSRASHGL